MSWIARTVLFAALLVAAAGCGYRTGLTLPDEQSIGVEVFDNSSKVRELELEMHDNLTDALDRMVHAPLVPPARADLVVRGVVLAYVRRNGIRDKNNMRLESGVRIDVRAQLVRPGVSGKPEDEHILRETLVNDERGFLVEDPRGELDARALVLRNIADRLVLDLFGDLAYEPPAKKTAP